MISNFQSTNYWLVGIGRRVFLANSKKSILSFCHSDKRTIILCNSYIGISTLSCPLLMPLELGIEVQLLLAYQTRKSYQTLPHINFVTKKVPKTFELLFWLNLQIISDCALIMFASVCIFDYLSKNTAFDERLMILFRISTWLRGTQNWRRFKPQNIRVHLSHWFIICLTIDVWFIAAPVD